MNRLVLRRKERVMARTMFDDGMYAVALVSPVLTLPQVLLIWNQHQTAGVSLFTWSAYTVLSVIWLVYGVLQKQKPLILSQGFALVVDVVVVLGLLIFR
jgi:uncharacterized protein with PQ loop repeat